MEAKPLNTENTIHNAIPNRQCLTLLICASFGNDLSMDVAPSYQGSGPIRDASSRPPTLLLQSLSVPQSHRSRPARDHLPYFWNSQSRLSRGQTCRAFSHLEMQWKWKACYASVSNDGISVWERLSGVISHCKYPKRRCIPRWSQRPDLLDILYLKNRPC